MPDDLICARCFRRPPRWAENNLSAGGVCPRIQPDCGGALHDAAGLGLTFDIGELYPNGGAAEAMRRLVDRRDPAPITDQPMPASNDHTGIWDLVIADMRDRDAIGRTRYGTKLQPFNGRKALVDAYQEQLDGAVYLRQRIEEDRMRKAEAMAILDSLAAADLIDGAGVNEADRHRAQAEKRAAVARLRVILELDEPFTAG